MDLSDKPLLQFTRLMQQNEVITSSNAKLIAAFYVKLLPSMLLRPVEKALFERHSTPPVKPEKSPVFVLGHWRSGTTYLQFLLSQDPKFIYHSKYQTFFPGIYKTTGPILKKSADAFLRTFNIVRAWRKNISINMDLDSPSETEAAAINLISPVTYHWAHIYPKKWRTYFNKFLFMEGLSSKEWQLWKQTMLGINSKLIKNKQEKRLLVKNPGDTGRIEHILKLYPNAKFVFIHRNPYEVFYSNKKLWHNILRTVSLQSVSKEELDGIILKLYKKLHQTYLDQKEKLRENQLAEVKYEHLKHRPIVELERIYDKIDLPGFKAAKPHFTAFMEDNTRESAVRKYEYQTEDIVQVNKQWGFTFEQWDYSMRKQGTLVEV